MNCENWFLVMWIRPLREKHVLLCFLFVHVVSVVFSCFLGHNLVQMGRKKRFLRAKRKEESHETVGEDELSVSTIFVTFISYRNDSKVPLDFEFDGSKYNSSNAIVLPSNKSPRETIPKAKEKRRKVFSKRQLKKLQCVVQRRQKKANVSNCRMSVALYWHRYFRRRPRLWKSIQNTKSQHKN